MDDLNDEPREASNQVEAQDDLLDDLMNIVQNDVQENSNFDQNKKDESENEANNFDNRDYENSEDDELYDDNEDIDQMLEKPIDILEEKDECNFYTYDKIQIKNIYWRGCQDTMLPEGWVQVTHACGMPLYLDRKSRVCTLSRPYYINEASARKHDIPISSIPCMAYKRRKEIVENQIKEHNQAKIQAQSKGAAKCPVTNNGAVKNTTETNNNSENNNDKGAKSSKQDNKKIVVSIQTNEEKSKENIMTPEQIHEYCKLLFEFDVVKVKKFKTWSDRKIFIRKSKQKNTSKFPENAKMLKIQTKTQKGINKELNINMTNKTALSILYEYASQVHKTNPRFEIVEKENPKDPFHAICYIADKISGKGTGNSKKTAKTAAAEAALTVLIPDFKSQCGTTTNTKKNYDDASTFFDDFPIEHSHIYLHSQKLGSPLPYDVLLTCLKYNFAINMSRNQKEFIEEDIKPIKYRNCLYRMKLAQYDVEVNCTKKKEGRQLASQKILQQMHPHLTTWGSILRLYCTQMAEALLNNDLKSNDSELVDRNNGNTNNSSNDKSKANNQNELIQKAKPNKELLEKLKEEMRKIKKSNNTDSNQATDPKDVVKDTLLTIPPLKLNNELGANYLMTTEAMEKKIKSDEPLSSNSEDKILFTNSKNNDDIEHKSDTETSAKKRKIDLDVESENDDDNSSVNTDSSNEDGELNSD